MGANLHRICFRRKISPETKAKKKYFFDQLTPKNVMIIWAHDHAKDSLIEEKSMCKIHPHAIPFRSWSYYQNFKIQRMIRHIVDTEIVDDNRKRMWNQPIARSFDQNDPAYFLLTTRKWIKRRWQSVINALFMMINPDDSRTRCSLIGMESGVFLE